MKSVVEVYTCECGRNIIILNDNFEDDTNIDVNDIECPACGGEIVSSMTREIEIRPIR